MHNWIFYGTDKADTRTIHYIKPCKKPQMTSEYKDMMQLLELGEYQTVGCITSRAWNKENQYIKITL